MVYVDESRCTGCGLCTDVCPTEAISVVEGLARVEQSLCQECEACLSACPNGALLALQERARAEQQALVRGPAPAPIVVQPVAPALRPGSGVWPWMGAVLGFVGREVVPRATAFLADRERREPDPWVSSRAKGLPGRAKRWGREGGRRARRRGRGW